MTVSPNNVATNPGSGAFSGTRSPTTGTLSGTFQENDLIIEIANCNTASTTAAPPAGWFQLLLGGTVISSNTNSLVAVGHFITAAEVTAATKSWTLTNLFGSNQSGRRSTAVYRGVDPAHPIGANGYSGSSVDSSPITFPTITPTVDNSLVVVSAGPRAVVPAENFTALAAPWTDVGSTYSNSGSTTMLCQGYGGPFTKGSPLTPAALPISRNDGWVAIAIELLPIPDKNSSVQFLAMF